MTERIVCTRCAIISRGFVGNCEHVQEAVAAAEVERLKRPSDLKPEDWVTAATAKYLLKEVNDARLQIEDWKAYVKLLGEELRETVGFADSHGWKSSRHEAGKALRLKLGLGEDWGT